jgi:serine/threonine protein kinase
VLEGTAVCEPAPLQESDLQNAGICHTFKGMEINDNLAGLRALTMPDGGMDLLDYCNELTVDEQAFKSINTLLLDLVENGIVPMSTAGIIHGDIKFENLVIDPQRKTSIRLIDWGNAKVSVPTMLRHTVTPLVFNRPPGSVFLHADINDRLATLSEQLGEEATTESLANALRESVGEHRDSANIDIIIRFVYGSDVTDIRTDRTTMQNTHLASILRKYYNGSVFEQQRFITETYIHNCDLYGFVVMYALMIAAMTQFEFENDTFDRTARRLVKDFVLSATYASDRMDSQKLLDAMHTLGACVDPRKRARLE